MAAIAWLELRLALIGAMRLARGDRGGLACFDDSLDGFWRSFRAAVLCYPLYLILLALRIGGGQWQEAGDFRILAVETIAYVISWVAFPLAVLPLTRWLGRERRFFRFMVAYNWCQLPEMLLFVLLRLEALTGWLPLSGLRVLEAIAACAVLFYEWYIARVALDTTGIAAVAVLLVNLVLGVLVSRVANTLY